MMIVNEREKISGEAPGKTNTLDISGSINIGGIPPKYPGRSTDEGGAGFFGCIKDFILNNRIVDLPNPYTREQRLLSHIEKQNDVKRDELIKGLMGDMRQAKSVNVGSCKSYRKNKKKKRRKREIEI